MGKEGALARAGPEVGKAGVLPAQWPGPPLWRGPGQPGFQGRGGVWAKSPPKGSRGQGLVLPLSRAAWQELLALGSPPPRPRASTAEGSSHAQAGGWWRGGRGLSHPQVSLGPAPVHPLSLDSATHLANMVLLSPCKGPTKVMLGSSVLGIED